MKAGQSKKGSEKSRKERSERSEERREGNWETARSGNRKKKVED